MVGSGVQQTRDIRVEQAVRAVGNREGGTGLAAWQRSAEGRRQPPGSGHPDACRRRGNEVDDTQERRRVTASTERGSRKGEPHGGASQSIQPRIETSRQWEDLEGQPVRAKVMEGAGKARRPATSRLCSQMSSVLDSGRSSLEGAP